MRLRVWLAVIAIVALLMGVGTLVYRRAFPRPPAVLICDFQNLLPRDEEGDTYALGSLRRGFRNDIATRLSFDPDARYSVITPDSTSYPREGFLFIVTGAYRLVNAQSIGVAATIVDGAGRTVKRLSWELSRGDLNLARDRVSWEISKALAELSREKRTLTRKARAASLRYAENLRLLNGSDINATPKVSENLIADWCRLSEEMEDPRPARLRLVETYRQTGDLASSFKQIAAMGLDPDDREEGLILFSIAQEARNLHVYAQRAADTVAMVAQTYPLHGVAWALHGEMLAPSDSLAAHRSFERAIMLDVAAGDGPNLGMVHFAQLYRIARAEGTMPTADLKALVAACGTLNGDEPRYVAAARELSINGLSEASTFASVLESHSVAAHYICAYQLLSRDRVLEARPFIRKATTELKPGSSNGFTDPTSPYLIGVLRDMATGRPRTRIPREKDEPEWARVIAGISGGEGVADNTWNKVLELDPLNRTAVSALTEAYAQQGHFDTAMGNWDRILKATPGVSEFNLGAIETDLLRWDVERDNRWVNQALEHARRYFRKQPDRYVREREVARLFSARSESRLLNEAVRLAEDSVKHLPNDAEAWRSLGWSHAQLACLLDRQSRLEARTKGPVAGGSPHRDAADHLRQAEDALQNALRLTPSNTLEFADISVRLADVALRSNNLTEVFGSFPDLDSLILRCATTTLSPSGLPVRVIALGHTVAVIDKYDQSERRRVLWSFGTDSLVTAVAVADIDGDGNTEIVVGTGGQESVRGTVYSLNRYGEEVWRYKVATRGVYAGMDDNMSVKNIRITDIDRDGRNEIIASANHTPWYPARMCFLDASGRLLGEYWNPGNILSIDTGSFANGATIAFAACNNKASRNSGWPLFVGFLWPDSVRGKFQALPYIGRGIERDPNGHRAYKHVAGVALDCVINRIDNDTLAVAERMQPTKLQKRVVLNLDLLPKRVGAASGYPMLARDNLPALVPDDKFLQSLGLTEPSRRYAVAIGQSDYVNAQPERSGSSVIRALRYTSRDAEAVAEVLRTRGGYLPADVSVGHNITRSQFHDLILGIGGPSTIAGAVIFIHYSGHGFVHQNELRFLMIDAETAFDVEHSVSLSEVLEWLRQRRLVGCQVVMTLDCCRDAPIPANFESHVRRLIRGNRGYGLTVYLPCRENQVARGHPQLKHGVMSYFVLKALNQPGSVTTNDLEAMLSNKVEAWCVRNGAPRQAPVCISSHSGKPVPITRPEVARRVR